MLNKTEILMVCGYVLPNKNNNLNIDFKKEEEQEVKQKIEKDMAEVDKEIGNFEKSCPFQKEHIFYFPPYTIVSWDDGTYTMVKTHNDNFDKEYGYAMAIARKFYDGNRSAFLKDIEDAQYIPEKGV
jgi:hypothetical protein